MIIAIDGPAGVGKSSISRYLAESYNLYNLNTGLFYRAVAYLSNQAGLTIDDIEAICELLKHTSFELKDMVLLVNGEDLESKLRTPEIDRLVSPLSSLESVRKVLTEKFRILAKEEGSLVAEGRDMTSVVFPDADYRFFITADVDVRAQRRYDEALSERSYDEIKSDIIQRDRIDQEKIHGRLENNKKNINIDTTYLSLEEVFQKIRSYVGVKPGVENEQSERHNP